ncbi:MAG: hypothetical protein H6Q59_1747 [Firmicutes bacterium]|nr:hypothetical protein [Bacillota bacterium]
MKPITRNKIIAITLPFVAILILCLRTPLLALTAYLPKCFIYQYLHLYCPACGNTRSITALLHGDLSASIRYNPVPVLGLVLAITAYVEFTLNSFGIRIRLMPRRLWFYLILILLLVIYFVLRNLYPDLAP